MPFRFERGIDPTIAAYALKRAALLVQEVAGGDISDRCLPKENRRLLCILKLCNVAKIIGQEIPKDTIKQILVSLDMKVNSFSETGLGLTIPAYQMYKEKLT
jgi:phenylalanyl-tRNA synthetase beta chain